RLVEAVENVHERGLAGAVLAQQGMHFSAADVHRHAVVGGDSGECLGDFADGEANGGAGRHRRQRRGCRCGMHMARFAAGAARNLCENVITVMDVLLPRTLEEALEMKAAAPAALPIAGGTDVMVALNFDRRGQPVTGAPCWPRRTPRSPWSPPAAYARCRGISSWSDRRRR